MLGDRGLLHPQGVDDLPYRPFLQRQIVQDGSPAGLSHRVEGVRSCRCACHAPNNTFRYRNMSSSFFSAVPDALPAASSGFTVECYVAKGERARPRTVVLRPSLVLLNGGSCLFDASRN